MGSPVTIVQACQRAGRGGSPTAVLDETPLSDVERRAVPVDAGTSHAVFVAQDENGVVALRFFTAAGELPACGHGTVAALAVLADRAGVAEYEAVLRSGGRTFTGRATGAAGRYEAVFDPGPVRFHDADSDTGNSGAGRWGTGSWGAGNESTVLTALGLDPASVRCRVASVGRPRMLVRVADRSVLAALRPDMALLHKACDQLGLLGCYVYTASGGRAAARMFAPAIGVPEDIANANSTACLAAHLAEPSLRVDMGDALGEPSTIVAGARIGPAGTAVEVGGTAKILPTPHHPSHPSPPPCPPFRLAVSAIPAG